MLDIQTILLEELVCFLTNGCQNEVLTKISQGFSELGFSKSIIFLKTNTSGELKQIYPFESDFKPNFKLDFNTKIVEPYVIEKIMLSEIEQNAVVLPLLYQQTYFGALVLIGSEQTVKLWSPYFKKIGHAFSVFMQALDLIQQQNLAENKKLKNKLYLLHLSEKQSTIAELLLNGRSNKEIAKAINLTEQAIKYHVGNMLSKFQCKNRKELRTKINELIV